MAADMAVAAVTAVVEGIHRVEDTPQAEAIPPVEGTPQVVVAATGIAAAVMEFSHAVTGMVTAVMEFSHAVTGIAAAVMDTTEFSQ
ncbi:MAG: hypothetical protein GXP30_04520, partial [Verrucomicrobia bacterium]|nr:hypothetical protein [Verrucomicrobiota bacterium]